MTALSTLLSCVIILIFFKASLAQSSQVPWDPPATIDVQALTQTWHDDFNYPWVYLTQAKQGDTVNWQTWYDWYNSDAYSCWARYLSTDSQIYADPAYNATLNPQPHQINNSTLYIRGYNVSQNLTCPGGTPSSFGYYSGMISSLKSYILNENYFEVRIKFDQKQGQHTSIWMTTPFSGNATGSNQIITAYYGAGRLTYSWNNGNGTGGEGYWNSNQTPSDFAEFVTLGTLYANGKIAFYQNRALFHTINWQTNNSDTVAIAVSQALLDQDSKFPITSWPMETQIDFASVYAYPIPPPTTTATTSATTAATATTSSTTATNTSTTTATTAIMTTTTTTTTTTSTGGQVCEDIDTTAEVLGCRGGAWMYYNNSLVVGGSTVVAGNIVVGENITFDKEGSTTFLYPGSGVIFSGTAILAGDLLINLTSSFQGSEIILMNGTASNSRFSGNFSSIRVVQQGKKCNIKGKSEVKGPLLAVVLDDSDCKQDTTMIIAVASSVGAAVIIVAIVATIIIIVMIKKRSAPLQVQMHTTSNGSLLT